MAKPKTPSWFTTYFSENNDSMLIFPSSSNKGLGEDLNFYTEANLIGVHLDDGTVSDDTSLIISGSEQVLNYELEFHATDILQL